MSTESETQKAPEELPMKFVFMATAVFACTIPCHAIRPTSGNDLMPQCKAALDLETALQNDSALPPPQAQRDAYHCMGIIEGVSETLDHWTFSTEVVAQKQIRHACIPAEVTLEQEIKIFLKYADAHPELLHIAGTNLVIGALLDAFPCRT